MLNPQQMTIDMLPEEQLATAGWNLRETQDNHRRQIEVCETQIQAIRQEFIRRSQVRQSQAKTEVDEKKAAQDAMVNEIVAKLAERNGHVVPVQKVEEEKKAE